jgi:hypothetical protein
LDAAENLWFYDFRIKNFGLTYISLLPHLERSAFLITPNFDVRASSVYRLIFH